jgi:hypothetical protein
MNRRHLLGRAVALPLATIILPRTLWAAMPKYDPADFGTVGAGDDTAAWQGALNAARSYNSGRGGIVAPDALAYQVGALDLTGANNVIIDAPNGCWLYGNKQTQSSAILDLTASNNCWLRGFVTSGRNPDATYPTILPKAGILLAETTTGGDSNKNRLDNIGSGGKFTSAALCVIGSTDNQYYSCSWQQFDEVKPCLIVSTQPDWGILSRFKTIATGASNVGDQTFVGCEFHGYRDLPPGNYWTSYFRNADNARFVGGVHDCSGNAHMLFQGNCKRITSVGQKFYSESGIAPSYIFEDQGMCDNLCVINPNKTDNAFSVGMKVGTFPNFREL